MKKAIFGVGKYLLAILGIIVIVVAGLELVSTITGGYTTGPRVVRVTTTKSMDADGNVIWTAPSK
jgi:hypothetical protein